MSRNICHFDVPGVDYNNNNVIWIKVTVTVKSSGNFLEEFDQFMENSKKNHKNEPAKCFLCHPSQDATTKSDPKLSFDVSVRKVPVRLYI